VAAAAPLAPPGATGLVAAAKARVDIAAQLKRMWD
jgi:DNA helicase II / ATP-dependent DNA helicase PcrA